MDNMSGGSDTDATLMPSRPHDIDGDHDADTSIHHASAVPTDAVSHSLHALCAHSKYVRNVHYNVMKTDFVA